MEFSTTESTLQQEAEHTAIHIQAPRNLHWTYIDIHEVQLQIEEVGKINGGEEVTFKSNFDIKKYTHFSSRSLGRTVSL